jgi:hypothetical protein
LIQFPATVVAIIAVSISLVLPKVPISDFKAGLKRVDFKGAISLTFAIFFLLIGLDRGGNASWNDTVTISSLIAFFVLSVVFVIIEFRFASEPFAPKRIIVNRSLFAGYLANFFANAAILAMLFHVSLYLQAVEGKTPSEAGLWLLPSIAGGVSGSLVGGLIMQRTGKYYWLTLWSYLAFLAGSVVIALTTGVAIRSFVGIAIGALLRPLECFWKSLISYRPGLIIAQFGSGTI